MAWKGVEPIWLRRNASQIASLRGIRAYLHFSWLQLNMCTMTYAALIDYDCQSSSLIITDVLNRRWIQIILSLYIGYAWTRYLIYAISHTANGSYFPRQ